MSKINLKNGLSKVLSVVLSVVMVFGFMPVIAHAEPGVADTYQLVTSGGLTDGTTYVIAIKSGSTYYAMNNTITSGYAGATSSGITVTTDGNWLTSTVPTSIQWTYAASGSYLKNGTNNLSRVSSTNNLQLSTSTSEANWSYSSNKIYVYSTSHYLVYVSGSGFNASGSSSGSGSTVYLFAKVTKTVSSIAITTPPTKTVYNDTESFDPTGMVVTATYNDSTTEAVTGYTYTPTGALPAGTTAETIHYGTPDKTATQTITVNAQAPTIGTQPSDINEFVGDTGSMSVTASVTDSGTLSYQWYSNPNGTTYSGTSLGAGARTSSYTPASTTAGTTYYYCVVTNTKSSKTATTNTRIATVTINANPVAPSISGQPSDITEYVGDTGSMSVTASVADGGTLSYQWYSNPNGTTYSGTSLGAGARTSSYTPASTAAGTTYYYCVVTNTKGTKTATTNSRIATVTVNANPQTPNITGQPSDITEYVGDTGSMTVTATSPDGGSLSYKWYNNGSNSSTYAGTLISGATGASYQPSSSSAGTVYYYCVVTNTKVPPKTATANTRIVMVVVSAVAVDHIAITTPPTQTGYVEGKTFDPAGMVVTAFYNNGSKSVVPAANYTYSPTRALLVTDKNITVTYTMSDGTFTATTPINVVARAVTGINVTTAPDKKDYVEGQFFGSTGMVVTATYNDGTTAVVPASDYTYSPTRALLVSDKNIAVTYTMSDGTFTATTPINVVARAVTRIDVTTAPDVMDYVEGQFFSPTGMVVTATYNDATTAVVPASDYTYSPTRALLIADKNVTVTYAMSNGTFTATTPISVVAKVVTSLAISNAPKTQYATDPFDPAGMVITAYYNDDTHADVNAGDAGLTFDAPDALVLGSNDITATYGEGTLKFTVDAIAVAVTGIGVTTAPDTKNYVEGQFFSPTGMVVTATCNDGSKAVVPASDYTYSPTRALLIADKNVTVTYTMSDGTFTATTPISVVARAVTGIGVTTAPDKKDYVEGQFFSPAGMVVTATYNDATTAVVPASDYTYLPTRALLIADKNVTVTYAMGDGTFTATTPISVVARAVTGIGVTTAPDKKDYVEGQFFSPAGMVVTATYNDATTAVVPASDYTYSPTRALLIADKNVTVTYAMSDGTFTATTPISVVAKVVTSLSISNAPKTQYATDPFDPAGMVITAYYNDDTHADVNADDAVLTFDSPDALALGSNDITATYGEGTLKFTVDAIAVAVTGISVTTVPDTKNYVEGQHFSPAGMVVTATYNDGKKAVVPASDYTYSPTRALLIKDKNVTVTYAMSDGTFTATTPINVVARAVTGIGVTTAPAKKDYVEGQFFSPTGMVVIATYNDGTTAVVPASDYTYSPTRALLIADKNVTVTYAMGDGTFTATTPISVVARAVTGIGVTTAPDKKDYVEGQFFSPAGMVVTATYNDGTTAVVPAPDYTYSPTRALLVSDKNITVTYTMSDGTFTATTPISVVARAVTGIGVTTAPDKKDYVEGQFFSPTGMVVTATYNDATTAVVPASDYTYSPIRALLIADKNVTVTYAMSDGTFTATTPISVVAKVVTSLSISNAPKTQYATDPFDPAGMVITAYYNDDTHADVNAGDAGLTFDAPDALVLGSNDITATYGEGTLKFTVNATAKFMTGILIKTYPPKTQYETDPFDPTGTVITATYNDKSHVDVYAGDAGLTFTVVSDQPNQLLVYRDNTINVTYGGMSIQMVVNAVHKVVTGIEILTYPTKMSYVENQSFEPAGAVIKVNYNDSSSVNVDDSMVSFTTNDPLIWGDNTVVATYASHSTTFTVNAVKRAVIELEVNTPQTKTQYFVGDLFSMDGLVLVATYNDGNTENISADHGLTCSTDPLKEGENTVTLTYGGVSMPLQIYAALPDVQSIDINTPPDKLAHYVEGQKFNPHGMVLLATYENGNLAYIHEGEGYTYSTDPLVPGDNDITVSYGGQSLTITVNADPKVVTGIAITKQPSTTTYVVGQSFSPVGMEVTATYNDDTPAAVTDYTYSPTGALTSAGQQTITVTYNDGYSDQTATVDITVVAKAVSSIAITTKPTKNTYVVGQSFSTAGMVVTATYNDGTQAKVTGYSYSPNVALTTVGNQKITVTYNDGSGDQTATVDITVVAKALSSIAITKAPVKTAYVAGETFDPTGMEVTATYNDATTAKVTGYTYSPNGALKTSDTTITVTFNGKTAGQPITVAAAKGAVQLTCQDNIAHSAFPGVGFKVYSDANLTSQVGTVTYISDASGIVLVTGLDEGTYYFNVVSVPTGYQVPKDLTFPVAVTSGDTTKLTLQIPKTQVSGYSTDQLKAINATAGTLSPKFDPTKLTYTLTLSATTGSTKVTPVLADSASKLYINKVLVTPQTPSITVTLIPGGSSVLQIKVVTKANETNTYTVTVVRAKSANNSLASLKPSVGTMTPAFSSTKTAYAVNLTNTQSSVTMSFALADKYATYTMKLDGTSTTSKTVAMKLNQTRILVITVKSQSGVSKSYTITIHRAISKNANLASLTVSKGKLSPVFSQAQIKYTLALTNAQASVTLTAKTADTTATFTITADGKAKAPGSVISVAKGKSVTVVITVKAQAGNIKTYTIVIKRAK